MTAQPPIMRRRGRSTALAWIAFLLVCATFISCMRLIERQRIRQAADYRRSKSTLSDIRRRIYLGRAVTPRSLADDFNNGQPLPIQRSVYPGFVDVFLAGDLIKPDYKGWRVVITFKSDPAADAALAVFPSSPQPFFDARDPTTRMRRAVIVSDRSYSPDAPEEWYQAQTFRRILLSVMCIAWVGVASLMFVAGPWRRKVAQICLAVAILGLIALLLDPTFSLQSRAGCTALPLGMIVVFTSALLVTLPPGLVGGNLRHCQHCGYDLQGNESGVCPECGTPTAAHLRRSRLAGFEGYAQAIEAADLNSNDDDVFVPLFAADAA